MDMNLVKSLLSKEWVRYIGVLLVGITIGVIFYPTKRVEEKITSKYELEMASLKQQHQKEINESQSKFNALSSEYRSYHERSEAKIISLTSKVTNLEKKSKKTYYKIVRPDGTVEIKETSESETEQSTQIVTQIQQEYQRQIDSIESKWKSIHEARVTKIQKDFSSKEENYKKQIQELQVSKVTTTNQKRFGLEVGMLNDRSYFGDFTADVWGPVYLGLFGTFTGPSQLGAGVGFRF